MSRLSDVGGEVLRCTNLSGICGVEGGLSKFSQYAQTATPLIQCNHCGSAVVILSDGDGARKARNPLYERYVNYDDRKHKGVSVELCRWNDFPRLPK